MWVDLKIRNVVLFNNFWMSTLHASKEAVSPSTKYSILFYSIPYPSAPPSLLYNLVVNALF